MVHSERFLYNQNSNEIFKDRVGEFSMRDINVELFRLINDLGKEFTALNPVMIFIAEYVLYAAGLSLIFFWFYKSPNNRIMVICGLVTVVVAEVVGKLAGMIHSNLQPFAELTNVNQLVEKSVGNSFPSDHTIIVFSLFITFCLFQRGWGYLWVVLATLVGVSRIWVGVHYPGDVLAAILISALCSIAVYLAVPKLKVLRNWLKLDSSESFNDKTSGENVKY